MDADMLFEGLSELRYLLDCLLCIILETKGLGYLKRCTMSSRYKVQNFTHLCGLKSQIGSLNSSKLESYVVRKGRYARSRCHNGGSEQELVKMQDFNLV